MVLPRTSLAAPFAVVLVILITGLGSTRTHSRDGGAEPAAPGAVAALPMPSLHVEYAAPAVRLFGVTPNDAERQAIVRRAAALYGAEHVTDALVVGSVAHPSWFDAGFMPDLRSTRRATAVLADARLQVSAELLAATAARALAVELARHRAQGLQVDFSEAVSPGP